MKKARLKDIAEHVGVSTALVSYVLNGQAIEKQVNKETAEKIVAAAKELNYLPNQIAKSLKTHRTNTIGLIVADISFRFSTGITRAIEAEAKKHNYTVIYGSSDENNEKFAELVNVFLNRRVDGLILIPVENSEPQIELLQKSQIPFVLVDRNFPEIKTNNITLDNYQAAYRATEYLINTGHKNIAFVNLQTSLFHLLERNRGYFDALKDNEISSGEDWLQNVQGNSLEKTLPQAIDRLLNSKIPFDALFFATDTLTINGLKYLHKKKLKVPDKISVLSFDESEAFELHYCPITHSRQPLEAMGKLAVTTLVNLIKHDKAVNHISLQAEIILGKSCREK